MSLNEIILGLGKFNKDKHIIVFDFKKGIYKISRHKDLKSLFGGNLTYAYQLAPAGTKSLFDCWGCDKVFTKDEHGFDKVIEIDWEKIQISHDNVFIQGKGISEGMGFLGCNFECKPRRVGSIKDLS